MIHLSHNDLIISGYELKPECSPVPIKSPEWFERPSAGIRLLQLSDLHFYENTEPKYYERVYQEVARLKPDIIVVTGDLIHKGPRFVKQAGQFLEKLSKLGSYHLCIMGNHDYQDEHDGAYLQETVRQAGFHLLVNEAIHCSQFKRQSQPEPQPQPQPLHHKDALSDLSVNVVGFDDYYYGPRCGTLSRESGVKVGMESLKKLPSATFTIGLAHNPLHMDVIHREAPSTLNWVFSGHTHAGHIWIPWLKPIYLNVFHHRYRYGWFPFDNTQLYVTSGVGSAAFYIKAFGFKAGLPRFRWNTNPEIAVFDLAV